MPLSQEQQKKAQAAVKKHLRRGCSVCGESKWQLGDIVHAIPYQQGAFVLGGPSIPVLFVVCTNCFHIVPFSAMALGLIGKGKSDG